MATCVYVCACSFRFVLVPAVSGRALAAGLMTRNCARVERWISRTASIDN
jgi:hypothetical protein